MRPKIQIISLFKKRTADLIYTECNETIRLHAGNNITIKTTSTPDFFTNFTHGDFIRVIGDNLQNEFGDGYYIITNIDVDHYSKTKDVFTIYGDSIFTILKNVYLKDVDFKRNEDLKDIFIELQNSNRHHRDFNNINARNMKGTDVDVEFDYFTVTTNPYSTYKGMSGYVYDNYWLKSKIKHDDIDLYSLIMEVCSKSDVILDNVAVQIRNKEDSINNQRKIEILFRIVAENVDTKKSRLIFGKHFNNAHTQTEAETPISWLRPTGDYIDSDPILNKNDSYDYIMYPFNNQGYFGNNYYNLPAIPVVKDVDIDAKGGDEWKKGYLIFNTSIDLLPTKKDIRIGERIIFQYQRGTTDNDVQQVTGIDVDYMTGLKTIQIGKNDISKYGV